MKGVVGTQLVGERAKIILDELRDLALFTREQCLQHIGYQSIFQCFCSPTTHSIKGKNIYAICFLSGEHFKPLMNGLENESYEVVSVFLRRLFSLIFAKDIASKHSTQFLLHSFYARLPILF